MNLTEKPMSQIVYTLKARSLCKTHYSPNSGLCEERYVIVFY